MSEQELARLRAAEFPRNNGKVLRAVNILRLSYNRLSGVRRVVQEEGVDEGEFLASVNFLTEEGYLRLRQAGSHEPAALSDAGYLELEAKLTGKAIRLLVGGAEDDMVELDRGAKSTLRAGNFRENNSRVLCTLNILSHHFQELEGIGRLLADDGIAEDEFLDSVNFLTEEGYLHLRRVATKEGATLADADWRALEGKLTGKGLRLLNGGMADDLIEV